MSDDYYYFVFFSIDNGTYVKHVSEKASIDLVFKVRNNGEHAYESMLFVYYDSNELDVPELRKIKGSINIGTFDENIVSFALGNPLNENEEVRCTLKKIETLNLSFSS
jgi:hypothetical protein